MSFDNRRGPTLDVDVAVVGAGPAGRWLGAQLVERCVSVALIDPDPWQQWPNTYGVWLDEVEGLCVAEDFRRIWARVGLYIPGAKNIERSYGLIDNERLRRRLDARLHEGGARFLRSTVRSVRGTARSAVVVSDEGEVARARLIVDASGGAAGLMRHAPKGEVAFQRACGISLRCSGAPLGDAQMVLMDYRPVNDGEDVGAPTFLYGMHLGGDRYFLEETVLVGPASVGFDGLRRRLKRRLEERGVAFEVEAREEERCHIPMGTPLPRVQGPVVAFGAAAGMVHPATGYQMGRMLRAGPAVAEAIARGIEEGMGGKEVAHRAWDVLWPQDRQRARELLIFGRDLLRTFNRRRLCRFFDAFFALPGDDWRDYLRGDVEALRLAQIMWRLFREVNVDLRWPLVRRAVADGGRLWSVLSSYKVLERR